MGGNYEKVLCFLLSIMLTLGNVAVVSAEDSNEEIVTTQQDSDKTDLGQEESNTESGVISQSGERAGVNDGSIIEVDNSNIAGAINALPDGQCITLRLTENIDVNQVLKILAGKDVIIDLAGYTLRSSYIDNYGKITIVSNSESGQKGYIKHSLNDCNIYNREGAELSLLGGVVFSERRWWEANSAAFKSMAEIENKGYLYLGEGAVIENSGTAGSNTEVSLTVTGIKNLGGSYLIDGGSIVSNATGQGNEKYKPNARAYGIDHVQGHGVMKDGNISVQAKSVGYESADAVYMRDGDFELQDGMLSGIASSNRDGTGLMVRSGNVIIGKNDGITDFEKPSIYGSSTYVSIAEGAQVTLYDGSLHSWNNVLGKFTTNKYEIPVTFKDGEETIREMMLLWGEKVTSFEPTKKGNSFRGWYKEGNKYDFRSYIHAPLTLYAEWNPILITRIYFDKPEVTCTEGDILNLKVSYLPEIHGSNETLVWESSNNKVAAIVDGKIKAVGLGSTTITAKLENDKSKTTSCMIEVIKKAMPVKNLKAGSAGKKRVELSWDKAENAEGYLIYAQKNNKYAYCGMVTKNTSFIDTKALDTDYNFYWVFPYTTNKSGKMHPGGCIKYVYAKGITPAVENLRATSYTGEVQLTWIALKDAEGYLVYGKTAAGAYGYKGMTTKGASFIDKKASKTEYNFYWVYPYHKEDNGKMVVGGTPNYVYGKAK